jgi:hypothetical protein
MDLKELSVIELLRLHSSVIDELRRRRIVRTKNNPIGDYTEWIVSKGMGLNLAGNSSAGYDGIDVNGTRIQIKGRRITPNNKSRQLSVIRDLDKKKFDYLAGVIFDKNYEIIDAVLIPHSVVGNYADYREHVNGHILHLKGAILCDPVVKSIKHLLLPIQA